MVALDSDVVSSVRNAIENAVSATDSANGQRQRAWQQFILAPTGTETDETGSYQSADVNSMITAVCAQMVIAFASDTVVTFEAESAEDEEKAAGESRAVNKIAVENNGGFSVMLGGVQNALLYKNGYLKVFWDEQVSRFTLGYEGIEPDDLPILTSVEPDEIGVERRLVSYDNEEKKARIETTQTRKRLRVKAVANERFFMTPDWDELQLGDCPLSGEIHYKTRNDLVRMGCDQKLVDQIPSTIRNTGQENSRLPRRKWNQVDPMQKSMEICRVYEAYAWLSPDEDSDYAYLYRVWLAGEGPNEWLLEPKAVNRNPYAAGTAFPIANQHDGEALAEKLSGIQGGKTELVRQWLMNVQNCSFGRYAAVVGQVELDDVINPKAGGPVRVKRPDALTPIPVIDVGASIGAAIDYLNHDRTERGGAAIDMLKADQQLAQETAHGTERVYSVKELLVSYMTRNLAESMIRNMFTLAHAELRDGDNGPIALKIADQWTQVDPSEWPERTYCNVKMGYSMGERTAISQTLFAGLQMYSQGLQAGMEGNVFTYRGLYKMMVDWLQVNLVDNPESYFVDPTSPQAQQAVQQKQQAAQQQAQQTADQASQIAALPEQIAAQKDKYKTDQDTGFKYFNAVLNAQVEAQKAERQGVIDFANARAESQTLRSANAGNTGKPPGRTGGKPNKKSPAK